MLLTAIFAVLAVIVIGAFIAQMNRRRQYEQANGEWDDDVDLDIVGDVDDTP